MNNLLRTCAYCGCKDTWDLNEFADHVAACKRKEQDKMKKAKVAYPTRPDNLNTGSWEPKRGR
jgi:hypothetical protein